MIANTPETMFLLQPELLAIKNRLEYKQNLKGVNGLGLPFTYRGYVNASNLREGVGISTFDLGYSLGEFHNGLANGTVKIILKNGNIFWGQFKNDNLEGYGESTYKDGRSYKGQYQNNKSHGYGISQISDTTWYFGQYNDDKCDGYGYMKLLDNSVIFGQWKKNEELSGNLHISAQEKESHSIS